MTTPFTPDGLRVLVPVTVIGPRGDHEFAFALDTGSNRTTLRPHLMQLLGFDLANPIRVDRYRGVVGGGRAPAFIAPVVSALGVTHTSFVLHAQPLNTAITVDGLLGLDFLRGRVLTLDFVRGRIALRSPRPWWAFWR